MNSDSMTQLVQELQSQVDLKKQHARVEADRDKEAYELNKRLDAEYWANEEKRAGLAKERQTELKAELKKQMDEKKAARQMAEMSSHELDFNKKYLENITSVRDHLQEEIRAKGQVVVPKTGGKKIIPQLTANAVGLAPS